MDDANRLAEAERRAEEADERFRRLAEEIELRKAELRKAQAEEREGKFGQPT